MSRRVAAVALAVALVAAALIFRSGQQSLPATPEDTVTALFDAAGRGDDQGYLSLTTGALRTSLENTRSELGVAAFRARLRQSAAGVKGLATRRGPPTADGGLTLHVELVYADRNERQQMTLVEQSAGWTITAMGTSDAAKPVIPYGTPVFEETPAKKPSPGR